MSDYDARLLDKRTVERYIQMGLVDDKAYEKLIKALPDLADRAVKVTTTPTDDEVDQIGDDEKE